jgi:light-regulated signal transduction histidine kinase (bacteriophytochrome)
MEILLRDLGTYIEAWGIQHNFTETVEAEASLNAALANCATTIKENGARVERAPLPSLHVDPTRLQQIFQNLIGNALKYRRPDIAPTIHIRVDREDGMWRFAVQDNGIGIAPEFHAQIFGLFKRLHARQRYPGTGIGLALCARIVEQYHGRIWVESQPGEGSTFYFTLPA